MVKKLIGVLVREKAVPYVFRFVFKLENFKNI